MCDHLLQLAFARAALGISLSISTPLAIATNPTSSQQAVKLSAGSRPVGAEAVPVLYAAYLNPEPLLPDQVEYVLAEAKAVRPAGRGAWFVLVLSHRNDRYVARVYFTPDEQTQRLRKGRYLYVQDPKADETRKELLKYFGAKGDASDQVQYRNYVQVSSPKELFGTKVETPTLPLLPFDKPIGISDSDIIAVVDLVRSGPHPAPVKYNGNGVILRQEFDATLPIHRIIQLSPDLIEVQTGWQVNLLAGYGQTLTCKRTAHGYELLDQIGEWRS